MNIFVDDFVVVSKSFEEHVKNIEIVLGKLRNVNLVINKSKCEFVNTEINFIDHTINTDGSSKGRVYPQFPVS